MLAKVDRSFLVKLSVPSCFVLFGFAFLFYRKFGRKTKSFEEKRNFARSNFSVVEIDVPHFCVASFIGKQGESIKKVRKIFSLPTQRKFVAFFFDRKRKVSKRIFCSMSIFFRRGKFRFSPFDRSRPT